ncbi:MAG: GNAT family N-acetyltransferase [Thermoleophilia bacterium]|nr:GNAT family N-acetyltransferase [Thermoleophilia bacterium]
MLVRRATPDDAGEVLELMAGLGRPAVAADPAAQRAVFLAHIAHPDGVVLVAEKDGELAGAASLWFRPRLNWTAPEAWLPDLYVRPAHRRRGVARALLDACVAEARARGCHALKLESGHDRTLSHPLYEAYGFAHHGRAYRLEL